MSDERDYKIGKGKPPPWTQFKKGQSGNPKGRPPKKSERTANAAEVDQIYRRELDRKYRVKDGDAIIELTGLEVAVRAQLQAAAKGSPLAQREVLRNAQELTAREQARREEAEREKRDWFSKAIAFKEYRVRIWAAAERDGIEPDDWPHPDDVLIDHSRQTWWIRGPVSETDVPLYEYMEGVRDLAFIEAELALRQRSKFGTILSKIWDLAWMHWDAELPLAWQMTPVLESKLFDLALNDTRKLRRLRDQWTTEVETLRIRAGVPWRTKEVYRKVNDIMKPLLRAHGYRSLAHLEEIYRA